MAKHKLPFESNQAAAFVHGLAPHVAAALGNCWSYDATRGRNGDGELHWTAYIANENGMRLALSLNWYEGRLSISGDYNESDLRGRRIDTPYNFERPRMTVDPMRNAEVIARDISRRLLPATRAAWGVYMERVRETRESQSQQAALADRLCATGLVHKARNGNGHDEPQLYLEKKGADWHGNIKASSESVTIELRYLNEAQALRVLRALEEG